MLYLLKEDLNGIMFLPFWPAQGDIQDAGNTI